MNQVAGTPLVPLQGITVVEICDYVSGPYAGKLLADLGADVIHVASPSVTSNGNEQMGSTAALLNVGKHHIEIDFTDGPSQELLRKLLAKVDVVVQNRGTFLTENGLGYDEVAAINPTIVYCQIGGAGIEDADIAGARADIAKSMTATQQDWQLVGPAITDQLAGMFAVNGILGALVTRERTGAGMFVTTDVLSSSFAFHATNIAIFSVSDLLNLPFDRPHGSLALSFRCSDNTVVAVHVPPPDTRWKQFLDVVGMSSLHEDPRYTSRRLRLDNFEALRSDLQEQFAKQPMSYWVDVLSKANIPIGTPSTSALNESAGHANESDVTKSYGTPASNKTPIRFATTDKASSDPTRPDTQSLLEQFGLSNDEVRELTA